MENYDTNQPLLHKCFFCKENDADKKYVLRAKLNETIYEDAVRHEYKQYKVDVPRCRDCVMTYLKYLLVIFWVIFGAMFMLIPLLVLDIAKTFHFGVFAVFIVFLANFIWSIYVFVQMRKKHPNKIKPLKKAAEYLDLISSIESELNTYKS